MLLDVIHVFRFTWGYVRYNFFLDSGINDPETVAGKRQWYPWYGGDCSGRRGGRAVLDLWGKGSAFVKLATANLCEPKKAREVQL